MPIQEERKRRKIITFDSLGLNNEYEAISYGNALGRKADIGKKLEDLSVSTGLEVRAGEDQSGELKMGDIKINKLEYCIRKKAFAVDTELLSVVKKKSPQRSFHRLVSANLLLHGRRPRPLDIERALELCDHSLEQLRWEAWG